MRRLAAISFWRATFLVIAAAGLYAIVLRFARGLGATTGMSDVYPWGIWIGFDVLCGVGLSAGGFTLAALVYVFRLEKYRAILRASVLTAFLGYVMVIVSLLCDLGLPYRIWHPLVMGNLHSPLFEVAMCVMFYTAVLALEFSPVVFERFGMRAPLRWIHTAIVPLVIVGVLLSTLHQSSLGTLYLIVPGKLHPLWYTPLLPLLFFVTAVGAGLSMIIFESYMSHRAFGTDLHHDVLQGLARASAVVLLVGLAGRFADMAARGKAGLTLEGSAESGLFWLEVALGSVVPAGLYLAPRVRRSRTGLFLTAVLVLCGFVLNRLNVSITGLQRYLGQSYFPTWMEMATSIFIAACGFAAFGLIARHFPVFPAVESAEGAEEEGVAYVPLQSPRRAAPPRETPIATPAGVAFLGGLALFFALGAILAGARETRAPARASSFTELARARRVTSARMAKAPLRVPTAQRFARSALSPGTVVFRHETHVRGQRLACETCHARLFPMPALARSTRPAAKPAGLTDGVQQAGIAPRWGHYALPRWIGSPAPVTLAAASSGAGHTIEMMDRCQTCHNGREAFPIRQGCGFCHARRGGATITAVSSRQIAPPADYRLTSQTKSPGPVTFRHRRHLAGGNGTCTTCHPGLFGMVPPGRGRLRMAEMRRGESCGRCHNGQAAFTVKNDCALCHRAAEPAPFRTVARVNRAPEDRVLRGNGSPAAVTFSHRSHLGRGTTCAACHPAVFGMRGQSPLRMAAMNRGRQCGACHDGRQAFTTAADCRLCHRRGSPPAARAVARVNRVPEDRVLRGDGSPGTVRFRHQSHVGRATQCGTCHPGVFGMRDGERLQMSAMNAGRQCGFCHNGRQAFTTAAECDLCHAEAAKPAAATKPAAPVVAPAEAPAAPADYAFPAAETSPGPVTFRHAGHLKAAPGRCADCHASVFPMHRPEAGSVTMANMKSGKQCGACHDGKRAFASSGDCRRCHAM